MAAENKPKSKKGRQRFLPYNKAVKKKGAYPLRPGVAGFFITCDGGRERQACHEAINIIDSYLEELIHGKGADGTPSQTPSKALNKKITFSYSDSDSSSDDDDDGGGGGGGDEENEKEEIESALPKGGSASEERNETVDPVNNDGENKIEVEPDEDREGDKSHGAKDSETVEPPSKKQCLEGDASTTVAPYKAEAKSVDKLIEEEIRELGDVNKRRFSHLDTGCNGVIFVQLRKKEGDPSPKDIVQHILTTAAATKKHMSRFILRILPVELSCYASEEEISNAIKPLVTKHFPADTQNPHKFSVLYGARANTGIDRMKIITAVAKTVPAPHTVDLSNPDKAIVVEIVKTVCLIGIVEKYKELAKYNLRQLTSQKPE